MEKRIDWIDFAKGFTILLVIIHHILYSVNYSMTSSVFSFIVKNVLGMVIATFIMPIFFAISGYLYKDVNDFKEYICMIYKKIAAYFIPYIVFNLIILEENGNLSLGNFLETFIYPSGHTWFLYSLLIIFMIFGVIDLMKINLLKKVIFIGVLFSLSLIFRHSGLHTTFVFIPYFFLGYLLKRHVDIELLFNTKIKCTIIFLITFMSLSIEGLLLHRDAFNANITVSNIISKILLVLIFFKVFMVFPKNKLYGFIEKNGKYSIIIFLVHWIIVGNFHENLCERLFNVLGTNDFTSTVVIVLSFIIAYIISLFIYWLCRYKIVRWIFFPRPFIDPLVKKTRFGKWIFS